MLNDILPLLAIGAVAGVFAGLLGVGGGVLLVPALVMLFERATLSPSFNFQLALGTSMATILFTSVSSFGAHHRHGAVLWPVVRQLTPGILVGTGLGTLLARYLSVHALAVFFTIFIVFVAAQMSLDFRPSAGRSLPGRAGMLLAAAGIGVVSALAAIGGGAMTVPFLVWCGVPVRAAIGTSAAVGFPIALGGTLGYVINGSGVGGLPPWSLGFVYLPALAAVLATGIVAAAVGARVAHRLPVPVLKRVFAGLLIVLAVKMLVQLFA